MRYKKDNHRTFKKPKYAHFMWIEYEENLYFKKIPLREKQDGRCFTKTGIPEEKWAEFL
jgi:hypothetical protein